MPSIKPLRKLVSKARDLRESHSQRHRPSGFGFALADSIDYLDAGRWDALTAGDSLFLSRRYLRVLEAARPENLHPRYALIFRGREAVAAVAAQSIKLSFRRTRKVSKHENLTKPLERLEERMLVCGNVLSWGMHGVAFAPGTDPLVVWPAVAEAIYRVRRADKLFGETDLVMVKDFTDQDAGAAGVLERFSYRPLETDPNMVLEISPRWKSYEDYLGSLTSKYRKTSKQIDKEVLEAGCTVEEVSDVGEIERQAESLHALYLQTHHNARLRLVTLPPTFLPGLAARLGEDMRWTVVRRGDQLLGFVNTVRDGETAVGYYIGFDRAANAEAPIYFRLLQAVVDHGIRFGCRRLSLGRTALEPKARLGARPQPMRVMVRHRIPMLNVLVRGLLHTVSHDEAPERNPFK
ncbi:MAG: GNAT family N-acetyltransferase [Acidobacteriota bacterium]